MNIGEVERSEVRITSSNRIQLEGKQSSGCATCYSFRAFFSLCLFPSLPSLAFVSFPFISFLFFYCLSHLSDSSLPFRLEYFLLLIFSAVSFRSAICNCDFPSLTIPVWLFELPLFCMMFSYLSDIRSERFDFPVEVAPSPYTNKGKTFQIL